MGSIQHQHLNQLTKQIWQWCESRDLWLHASYVPSCNNKADESSRVQSLETEWELAKFAYNKITNRLGNPKLDLFASKINAKCNNYVSWFKDPDSIAVDAFTIPWNTTFFYAFPPFSVILRTLQKISADEAEGIVVVPDWPTQPWYPLFRKLLVAEPVTLEPNIDLLSSPFRKNHPLHAKLTLVAGRLCGKLS